MNTEPPPISLDDAREALAAASRVLAGAGLPTDELRWASELLSYQNQQLINARKTSEQQRHETEEALRAKDAFLGIASHELRSPISAFTLQLQLYEKRLT